MVVGLPGVGIGGLFYLASVVVLPFRGAWRRLRGVPDAVTLRQLALQLSIAAGIVAALWGMGWLLTFVVPDGMRADGTRVAGSVGAVAFRTALPVTTLVIGAATLAAVLLAVEVARLLLARTGRRRLPTTGPEAR